MFALGRPIRHLAHLLPYPLNLVVVLIAIVVPAWIWWQSTRDDPVLRGKPYGRVVPYPEWTEPGLPDDRAELGGGTPGPNA